MDTKPLEIQAEDLIKHKLLKFDFLVTKPTFDKEGADLLIIKDISQKVTSFIKIQCKGRTIDKNSNVVIPKNRELNCYLIYSIDFGLEHIVEIGDLTVNDFLNGEVEKFVGKQYNLYKSQTDDLVSFKIEEQLNRLINTENVLLVADDPAYIPYLEKLKEKGIEIKIAQMKGDYGSRMHHKFRYADIMYQIGISIGLEKFEL